MVARGQYGIKGRFLCLFFKIIDIREYLHIYRNDPGEGQIDYVGEKGWGRGVTL